MWVRLLIVGFAIFATVLVFGVWLMVGYEHGRRSVQREAVMRGLAEFDGVTREFKWKPE